MKPVLITAGATRNPIDAMRYLSAHSSGKTGALIASQLVDMAAVTVLCSPEAELHMPELAKTEQYGSTYDLMERMQAWVQANPTGLVIHAAAVGDYAPLKTHPQHKIPSGKERLTITLAPTPKILDHIYTWSNAATIVSFKAAPPTTRGAELESVATRQLKRTMSDIVFANTIGDLHGPVILVDQHGSHRFETRSQALQALIVRLTDLCATASDLA